MTLPWQTKIQKYDVRRTVAIRNPVTGSQIVNALKQVGGGDYYEELLRNVDGQPVLKVGIWNGYPCGTVAIRAGASLEEEGIELSKTYDQIGVTSTEPPKGKPIFGCVQYEDSVIKTVEQIKEGLEKLL